MRELLEDIVSRQLVSDVPLCMLLSGGLDSSVLTALASKAVNGNGGLRSFSVDFNGHDDSFEADQLRGSHDQPFVHEMVRHLGVEHRDIVLDTKQLCDATTRKSVLNAWDLPNHMGDMDVSLYLLFEAIREHSTVAISGESADEVFGGYPWVHDKAALEIPIYPWIGFQAGKGTPAPFSLFDPELIQKLNVWEYLGGVYSDAIAEAPRLEGEERRAGAHARGDLPGHDAASCAACSTARTARAWPSGSRSACRSATTGSSSTSSTRRGR